MKASLTVVCFFVLPSRPHADHVCGPWRATVWDTEQFPGLPGNEVNRDQAFLPSVLVTVISLRGLRTALGGMRPWKLERESSLLLQARLHRMPPQKQAGVYTNPRS